MQVCLKPFSIDIKLDDNYSYHDFIDYLKAHSISCEVVRKQRRLFVNDMNDDYIVGFLLSKRDFTSHCQCNEVDGKIMITLKTLEEGVEFNFFMLNKQFLNGVYLSYSTAATIKTLEQVLKQGLKDWFESQKAIVNNATWRKNNIICSHILSQETIDSVLNKMSEITQMTFIDAQNNSGLFRPGYIKRTRYKLIFDKKKMGDLEKVKKDISNFVKSNKASSIAVSGKDNTQAADTINFDCLTTTWKSYDYDQLTKEIVSVDVKNLKEHNVSKGMLQIITSNPEYKTLIESK